jgi:hypothetical protein
MTCNMSRKHHFSKTPLALFCAAAVISSVAPAQAQQTPPRGAASKLLEEVVFTQLNDLFPKTHYLI